MGWQRSVVRQVPLRAALVIDAPPERIRAAATSAGTWARAAAADGVSMEAAGAQQPDHLAPGRLIQFAARGRRALFRVAESPDGTAELVRLEGVGRKAAASISVTASATPAGSVVTVDVRYPRSIVAARTRILRRAQLLLGVMLMVAAGPKIASAASDRRASRAVVAGVVIRNGEVLAARRTYPPELAGHWECPGGKVEPGELETDALARELDEELGIAVAVGERIGPECDLGNGYVLHAYRAEVISGEPSPTVHDAVRWVGVDEIDSLPWLPSDAPLVAAVRRLLTGQRS